MMWGPYRIGKVSLINLRIAGKKVNVFDVELILFYLFTLGAYGDVMRVKILFNKPNTALIQFADSQHAQTGKRKL